MSRTKWIKLLGAVLVLSLSANVHLLSPRAIAKESDGTIQIAVDTPTGCT